MKKLLPIILLAAAAHAAPIELSTATPLTGAEADQAADKILVIDGSAATVKPMALAEAWKSWGGTNVSATEMGYLDGVTSAIQPQLNAKQATITTGSLALSALATDPLARANHTGTQALSTLSQSGATSGKVPKWNGSAWVPAEDTGGTVTGADVRAGIEEDAPAARESIGLTDPRTISDALNWQPYVMARMYAYEGASTAPIRVTTAGDSLSTQLNIAQSMGNSAGIIGMNIASGSSGVTSNTTDWIAPIDQIAVGGSAVFHAGGAGMTAVGQRADRLVFIYIKEPTSGAFDYSLSSDGGSTWGSATNIDTTNASKIGAATVVNPSTSNTPAYVVRINNVTGGAVKIIAVGLYNSAGGGVVELKGLANLGGIDVVNFGNIPAAVFNPVWTALAPDLVLSHFADDPNEWDTTKLSLTGGVTDGDTTITFDAYPVRAYAGGNADRPFPKVGDRITGTDIPAGTYVTAHSENTQTLTLSQAATGSSSGLTFNLPGAWTDFYSRCKAAFAATDFIQISENPVYYAAGSAAPVWSASSVAHLIGDRVVNIAASGTGTDTLSPWVYICTADHTSSAATQPGYGASWETVWEASEYDTGAIAAGNARAAAQAAAQRTWALANNESFINGFAMFRGYREGCEVGLLAGDRVHPTEAGHRFKNQRVWDLIPISRLFWNSVGKVFGGDSILHMSVASSPATSPVEFSRAVNIRQATSGGLTLWDRSNINTAANAKSIYADLGNTHLPNLVLGQSSFAGAHPTFNGSWMGGRGSFWWNLGGAGIRLEYRGITASETVLYTDYTVAVTANDVTVTLPAAVAQNATVTNYTNAGAGVEGRIYVIKNSTAANTTTIATTSSQTIDGAAPGTLTAGQSIKVQSTGAGWITIP